MKRKLAALSAAVLVCAQAQIVFAAEDAVLYGDLNADGALTVSDAVTLQRWLIGSDAVSIANPQAADLSGDGAVNAFDLGLLKGELLRSGVHTQDVSIIEGICNGMTQDEVFAIVGTEYDHYDEGIAGTESYYYNQTALFGTALDGQMFVEFDRESGLLVNYGYHIGLIDTGESTVYPYTEVELKAAYDTIIDQLTLLYGAGIQGSASYMNCRAEYTWETDFGQIWAIYGVNLWSSDEPESYETGCNEIVVSCSVV